MKWSIEGRALQVPLKMVHRFEICFENESRCSLCFWPEAWTWEPAWIETVVGNRWRPSISHSRSRSPAKATPPSQQQQQQPHSNNRSPPRTRSPSNKTRSPPKARTPQVPAKYLDGKLGQLALLKDLKHLRSAIEEASKPAAAKPLERGMSQRDRILLKRGQSSTDYRI